MSFHLPPFAEQYVGKIRDRVDGLITQGIWEGLTTVKVRGWLANFRTNVDRYFAACLLDSLIYRSERQTIALAKQLFQRSLPDLERRHPPAAPIGSDWLPCLRRDSVCDPGIRLVPVIRSDDQPTKSAFLVTRMLKRQLAISESWIIRPDEISTAIGMGVQQIVFIDDFLGTGHQFEGFAQSINLPSIAGTIRCTYAPLAAHVNGIRHVSSNVAGITVTASEYLTAECSLFHPSSCLASVETGRTLRLG